MNKIYKLVYSRTLNSLVAVSELAKAAKASSSVSEDDLLHIEENKARKFFFTLNKVVVSASLLMGLPALATASNNVRTNIQQGDVVATTANNGKIVVDETSQSSVKIGDFGGTAVINIANADSHGVSDNRFKAFSTDKGAVFNNQLSTSSIELQSKVLGVKIATNPNLKKEAEVILAQITGGDKSVIKGALEILGKKADLMIINPNGIDLNGASLINVKDFTASTAEVNANNAKSLDVNRGDININGDLTSDDVNMIRLIAHAIKVKAAIAPSSGGLNKGKKADIIISAGKQTFDVAKNTAKAKTDYEQYVAISGTALGAMYGSKISFLVSGSGAGVEYDGMVLGDDNISITAEGNVKLNKVLTEKDLSVTARKVEFGKANATQRLAEEVKQNIKDGIQVAPQDQKSVTSAGEKKDKFLVANNLKVKANIIVVNDTLLGAKDKLTLGPENSLAEFEAKNFDTSSVRLEAGSVLSANTLNVFANSVDVKKSTITANNVDISAKAFGVSVEESSLRGDIVNIKADNSIDLKKDTIEANSLTLKNVAKNPVTTETNINNSFIKAGQVDLTKAAKAYLRNTALAADLLSVSFTNTHTKYGNWTLNIDTLSKLSANRLLVESKDLNKNAKLAFDSSNFDKLKTFLGKIEAKSKTVNADSVTIAKKETVELSNNWNVTRSFVNNGILNTSASLQNQKRVGDEKTSVVISVGDKFENYGMLVADSLGVKAANEIKLDGLTFTYNDLTLVSPKVSQIGGSLRVTSDLNMLTDSYKVEGKVSGKPMLTWGQYKSGKTWNYQTWRKDYYEVDNQALEFVYDDIKTLGGDTTVGGSLNIAKLQGTDYAVGTASAKKTAADVAKEIRLDAKDADINVKGNVNVEGNVKNLSSSFSIDAIDYLYSSGTVRVKYKPVTYINTDLIDRKSVV